MSLKKQKQNQLNDLKPKEDKEVGFLKENFTAIVFFSVLLGAIIITVVIKSILGVVDSNNIKGKSFINEEKDVAVLTYPADFLGDNETREGLIETLKEKDGIEKILKNDDGSLTVKMNMNRYKKIKDAVEITARGMIVSTINEESGISDISPSEDFTQINITVDRANFKKEVQNCVHTARMYLICNMQHEKTVTVNYIDVANGKTYLTEVYSVDGKKVSSEEFEIAEEETDTDIINIEMPTDMEV